MRVHQLRDIWLSLLFFPTGVGIALLFTALESGETWLQILVGAIALGSSFAAGLLSQGLGVSALLPIVVLACLAGAFGLFGAPDADLEPIAYMFLLTLIYGGVAYFAFGAGWIVRGLLFGFNGANDRNS